jgi:hypothetical protein
MEEYTRRLIHVPIIHAPADMGTMGAGLEAACIEKLGRRHWDEYLALIETFWQSVRTGLDRFRLDYGGVDLYQDGLPVCGKELAIVKAAAAKGSENHQLLLDLIARGATLMGTEDPKLLLEEYRNVQSALASESSDSGSAGHVAQAARTRALMAERDAYVGRRINESLRPGRTGILFLGLMHNVESYLADDIVVTRLHQPVARRRNTA